MSEEPKPDFEQRASNALSAVMCVIFGAIVIGFAGVVLVGKLRAGLTPIDGLYALADAGIAGIGVWLIRIGIALFQRGKIGPELTGGDR